MTCFDFDCFTQGQQIRGSLDTFPYTTTETITEDVSVDKKPVLTDHCKEFNSGGLSGLNELASPGFPKKYPPNVDCVRVIFAPSSYDVVLHFKNVFQIETSYEDAVDVSDLAGNSALGENVVSTPSNCPNDYLEVRDGRYSFSPLIGQFCGMRSPVFEIRAKSGFMWLHFHSDNLLEYRGFMAEYEFMRGPIHGHGLVRPVGCYFSFAMPLDGIIDMNAIKQFYRGSRNDSGSLDCVFQIQVPKWLSIAIFAEDFVLAAPNQCHKNFLEIYSGMISNSPLKRYCGITANHVYSNQPTVFVRFFASEFESINNTRLKLLFSTYVALKNCSSLNLFSCGDDICIPQELVCSGRSNCLYGRDEQNCHNQENVKSIVLSSYGTLIFIVFMVVVIVVGLFFWYNPCETHEATVDAYLKDLCSEPPPGLNQKTRQRAASKRISSLVADFTFTPESSPSRSESMSLEGLAHHLHCPTAASKSGPKVNGTLPGTHVHFVSQHPFHQEPPPVRVSRITSYSSSPSSSTTSSLDRRHTDSNIPYTSSTPSAYQSQATSVGGVPRILASRRLHSIQLETFRRRTSTETVVEVADEENSTLSDQNAETSFFDDSPNTVIL